MFSKVIALNLLLMVAAFAMVQVQNPIPFPTNITSGGVYSFPFWVDFQYPSNFTLNVNVLEQNGSTTYQDMDFRLNGQGCQFQATGWYCPIMNFPAGNQTMELSINLSPYLASGQITFAPNVSGYEYGPNETDFYTSEFGDMQSGSLFFMGVSIPPATNTTINTSNTTNTTNSSIAPVVMPSATPLVPPTQPQNGIGAPMPPSIPDSFPGPKNANPIGLISNLTPRINFPPPEPQMPFWPVAIASFTIGLIAMGVAYWWMFIFSRPPKPPLDTIMVFPKTRKLIPSMKKGDKPQVS